MPYGKTKQIKACFIKMEQCCLLLSTASKRCPRTQTPITGLKGLRSFFVVPSSEETSFNHLLWSEFESSLHTNYMLQLARNIRSLKGLSSSLKINPGGSAGPIWMGSCSFWSWGHPLQCGIKKLVKSKKQFFYLSPCKQSE